MRTLPILLLLGSFAAFHAGCGGEDDAPPPAQKPLKPTKTGGNGGGSGSSGSSSGGSGGASGKGGSGNAGGSSGEGPGGSNAGGTNAGGTNAGGTSAGGTSAGGTSAGGTSAGGTSAGGTNAGGTSAGGTSAGGTSAGGTNAGGANAGGANAGGTSAGGANAGGANAGGANAGGTESGGAGGVIEGKCKSKEDCTKFFDRPLCDTTTSLCVECLADADCTSDPDEKICDPATNQCVQCLKESDCSGHANGPHCKVSTSKCTCKNNAECQGSSKGKLCDVDSLQRCGECITAFDCKDPQKPGCSLDDVCFKGDFCVGDDASEAGDDGPLGAVDVTPEVLEPPDFFPPWVKVVENRQICDLPTEESDWYRFSVEDRDSYEVSIEWSDAEADLDLVILDAQGRLYGYNYFGRPAKVLLTYLPKGTLYAFVYRAGQFDKLSTTPTPYTVRVTRLPEAGKCVSSASCAENYNTQFYRAVCEPFSGVCRFLDGNKLGKGQLCDDDKDCDSGLCTYQPFTSDAHARSFCTEPCDPVTPCPSGQRCASYLVPEACVPACGSTAQCHVSTSTKPPEGQAWFHLTCNQQTGDCE